MIQLAQQLDYFENIHSIPGIGKLSTAMIIGESDLNQINNSMLLLALISNDINHHTHCRDTINKRGKKRENFYFMNIIRGQHHYDNHVVDYY